MNLKFTWELCFRTMKNYAKIEEKLTCQFKIAMRNLANFDLSTQNLKNLQLTGLPLAKVYNV